MPCEWHTKRPFEPGNLLPWTYRGSSLMAEFVGSDNKVGNSSL